MKLIGIEEHFLTEAVQQAWHAIALDAVDPSVGYHSGAIKSRLIDLATERLELMDETGLDVQVLSLTTPALHDLGRTGVDLARRANDAVAEAIARRPTRFQGLATLPIACPHEAALELQRCVETLGFKGAMLCGRVGDRPLDDPLFAPVFKSAEALGAPVLLHPGFRRKPSGTRTIPASLRRWTLSSRPPGWAGTTTPASSFFVCCCPERLIACPACR